MIHAAISLILSLIAAAVIFGDVDWLSVRTAIFLFIIGCWLLGTAVQLLQLFI
jgi:hypothetical protein